MRRRKSGGEERGQARKSASSERDVQSESEQRAFEASFAIHFEFCPTSKSVGRAFRSFVVSIDCEPSSSAPRARVEPAKRTRTPRTRPGEESTGETRQTTSQFWSSCLVLLDADERWRRARQSRQPSGSLASDMPLTRLGFYEAETRGHRVMNLPTSASNRAHASDGNEGKKTMRCKVRVLEALSSLSDMKPSAQVSLPIAILSYCSITSLCLAFKSSRVCLQRVKRRRDRKRDRAPVARSRSRRREDRAEQCDSRCYRSFDRQVAPSRCATAATVKPFAEAAGVCRQNLSRGWRVPTHSGSQCTVYTASSVRCRPYLAVAEASRVRAAECVEGTRPSIGQETSDPRSAWSPLHKATVTGARQRPSQAARRCHGLRAHSLARAPRRNETQNVSIDEAGFAIQSATK